MPWELIGTKLEKIISLIVKQIKFGLMEIVFVGLALDYNVHGDCIPKFFQL